MDIPEQLKCGIASYSLEWEADSWWRKLQQERSENGKSKVFSWKKMKNLLLRRFMTNMCSTQCPNQPNKREEEVVNHPIADFSAPVKCLTECPSQLNKQGKGVVNDDTFTKCSTEVPYESGIGQQNEEPSVEEEQKCNYSATCDLQQQTVQIAGKENISTIVQLDVVACIKLPKEVTPLEQVLGNYTELKSIGEEKNEVPSKLLPLVLMLMTLKKSYHVYFLNEAQGSNAPRICIHPYFASYNVQMANLLFICVVDKSSLLICSKNYTYINYMDIFLFDPGGDTYLSDSWGLVFHPFPRLHRLVASRFGTLVFSSHSNGAANLAKRDCDSRNDLFLLGSGTTDTLRIFICESAPHDSTKHDKDVKSKEEKTEVGDRNLHIKKSENERWARNYVEVGKKTWDLKKEVTGTDSIVQVRPNPQMSKEGLFEVGMTLEGPVSFEYGDQLIFRRTKLVNSSDIVTSPFPNGCLSLTCSIFGEFMGSNSGITEVVSFLFDPGGVTRLAIKRNFGNYLPLSFCIMFYCTILQFVVGTELVSIRICSVLDSWMMLRDEIAKRNVLCWCLWLGNTLDGLVQFVKAFSLKSDDQIGGRILANYSVCCPIYKGSSWLQGESFLFHILTTRPSLKMSLQFELDLGPECFVSQVLYYVNGDVGIMEKIDVRCENDLVGMFVCKTTHSTILSPKSIHSKHSSRRQQSFALWRLHEEQANVTAYAFISFDPGGITNSLKTWNSVSHFCPNTYLLFVIINCEWVGEYKKKLKYSSMSRFIGCFEITKMNNEDELLRQWFAYVQEVEPGIFVGCYDEVFCWSLLDIRTTHHRIRMHTEFGCKCDRHRGTCRRRSACHLVSFIWDKCDSYLQQGNQGLKTVTKTVNLEDMVCITKDQQQRMASYSFFYVAIYCSYMTYVRALIISFATNMLPRLTSMQQCGTSAALEFTMKMMTSLVLRVLIFKLRIHITRGRVIMWEEWNDASLSYRDRKIIKVKLSVGTFTLRLRLFSKLVNGLDPPMMSYGFARGRAYYFGERWR